MCDVSTDLRETLSRCMMYVCTYRSALWIWYYMWLEWPWIMKKGFSFYTSAVGGDLKGKVVGSTFTWETGLYFVRGRSGAGAQRCDCDTAVVGAIPTRVEYFHVFALAPKQKSGVKFRHATTERGERRVLTLGFFQHTQLCAGYSVKLISIYFFLFASLQFGFFPWLR